MYYQDLYKCLGGGGGGGLTLAYILIIIFNTKIQIVQFNIDNIKRIEVVSNYTYSGV